jgi:hypothetical protein
MMTIGKVKIGDRRSRAADALFAKQWLQQLSRPEILRTGCGAILAQVLVLELQKMAKDG